MTIGTLVEFKDRYNGNNAGYGIIFMAVDGRYCQRYAFRVINGKQIGKEGVFEDREPCCLAVAMRVPLITSWVDYK